MRRIGSTMHNRDSYLSRMENHQSHGRDAEEKERRRREWLRQQEREREHEKFKRKKIEEWEKKRRAEEKKNDKGRSSYRSRSGSTNRSSSSRKKVDCQPSVTKPSVMSQKFESSSNNTRLFQGPENTVVDVAELRRIKVDIHRNIPALDISTELRREILDPEDVKLKRREGEGSKPIFERQELMKTDVPMSEVEERRTVVALDSDRTERRPHTTRKRSTSPMNSHKQHSHNSRRDGDAQSSRRETSKYNNERSESRSNRKHDSERVRIRDRSKEHGERHKREDSRERRSPRVTSRHDVNVDRRNRSNSRNRESRRNDSRRRSSRDRVSYRDNRPRDNSRDRTIHDNRSRDRMPHHYAETMPVPMYYEGFHPRPIMVGPIIPMRAQMPMGRGRMPSMMGPMRPPFPPRFLPPEMFRPALNPNQRFGRMF